MLFVFLSSFSMLSCVHEEKNEIRKKSFKFCAANQNWLDNHYIKLFTDWCHLLLTFENRLAPNQAWQNVRPDMDPNCLTLIVFLKEFFNKNEFWKKKNGKKDKKHANFSSMQWVKQEDHNYKVF